jgi:hypothetical protein
MKGRAKFFGSRKPPIIGARKPDDNHSALDPRRSVKEAWDWVTRFDLKPDQQSFDERLDLKS